MTRIPSPLFRDPIFDGAADPVVIWNRAEKAWWLLYTARRATAPATPDVAWVHGTDIGVASSSDGGASWAYRGTLEGLDTDWGRHTYWAPEVIDDGYTYHLYVSVIKGVPTGWVDHARNIRHYTSTDLKHWVFQSTLTLGSDRVIDACIYPLPAGGFRMWFKDESQDSHTYAADSTDLYNWTPTGPVLEHAPHEGPNVFELSGWYWLIIDEWVGLGVYRSSDAKNWHRQGRILDKGGTRDDDAGFGLHADVVVVGENAYILYFTHPGRDGNVDETSFESRRSSIQVARLVVVDDDLQCFRDEELAAPILPLTL